MNVRDCPDCEQGKHLGCLVEVLATYSLGPSSEAQDMIEDVWVPCPCAERNHNVMRPMILDHGDLFETIVLTKDNIPEIASQTQRSEQSLRDALSHAKVMGRICYIAFRYSY